MSVEKRMREWKRNSLMGLYVSLLLDINFRIPFFLLPQHDNTQIKIKNAYTWIQTLNLSRPPSQPHLKYFPHHTGTFQWRALMLLQSNNLPTLYWKLTKTVIKFTKSLYRRISTVSSRKFFRSRLSEDFFCADAAAVTSNNHCHWKWDELVESSLKIPSTYLLSFRSVHVLNTVGIC